MTEKLRLEPCRALFPEDVTKQKRKKCREFDLTTGYLEKSASSFEIKACEKFYRRHIIDIPRIKFRA